MTRLLPLCRRRRRGRRMLVFTAQDRSGDRLLRRSASWRGGTGEEYAVHLENVIVLETSDAGEAGWYIRYLELSPFVAQELSREARRTARRFLWDLSSTTS